MDFDVAAFYDAIDEQRRARRLSWAQVAREISAQFDRSAALTRPVSTSTLSSMRSRRVIEGDGALQALRWLGRSPESFGEGGTDQPLPNPPPNCILRFDTGKIYALLNTRRAERGLTWAAVAREIGGVAPASLTRYAQGGRTAFPEVMRILRWLGRSAASITKVSPI